MAKMDGKIVDTAEKMMRRLYHLSDNYYMSSYSVKPTAVELTMSNSLIVLKAKFPTMLIEENIELEDELLESNIEEEELDENNSEEVNEPIRSVKKPPIKK